PLHKLLLFSSTLLPILTAKFFENRDVGKPKKGMSGVRQFYATIRAFICLVNNLVEAGHHLHRSRTSATEGRIGEVLPAIGDNLQVLEAGTKRASHWFVKNLECPISLKAWNGSLLGRANPFEVIFPFLDTD
ncbi:hypothetical protein B0H14DRAFT_2591407, partial [Mycena olivaceomarginata]